MSNVAIIVLIIVLLMLFGALPAWPHAASWGYGPGGVLFVILIIVLVLAISGKL